MNLTFPFKQTVQARALRDPAFREALLSEGVEALLSGDLDTGKAVLRDYINATVGFERLADATGTPSALTASPPHTPVDPYPSDRPTSSRSRS